MPRAAKTLYQKPNVCLHKRKILCLPSICNSNPIRVSTFIALVLQHLSRKGNAYAYPTKISLCTRRHHRQLKAYFTYTFRASIFHTLMMLFSAVCRVKILNCYINSVRFCPRGRIRRTSIFWRDFRVQGPHRLGLAHPAFEGNEKIPSCLSDSNILLSIASKSTLNKSLIYGLLLQENILFYLQHQ